MSDLIQILITNLGILIVAFIPLIGLYFKKVGDNAEELKNYITAIITAVALVAASMFAVWNARAQAAKEKEQNIEAVKALQQVPEQHKPEARKMMGLPPKE